MLLPAPLTPEKILQCLYTDKPPGYATARLVREWCRQDGLSPGQLVGILRRSAGANMHDAVQALLEHPYGQYLSPDALTLALPEPGMPEAMTHSTGLIVERMKELGAALPVRVILAAVERGMLAYTDLLARLPWDDVTDKAKVLAAGLARESITPWVLSQLTPTDEAAVVRALCHDSAWKGSSACRLAPHLHDDTLVLALLEESQRRNDLQPLLEAQWLSRQVPPGQGLMVRRRI